jgi:tetratricopeptide (TPR) repeat protein
VVVDRGGRFLNIYERGVGASGCFTADGYFGALMRALLLFMLFCQCAMAFAQSGDVDWSFRLDSARSALRSAKPGSEAHGKLMLNLGRALRMLDRSDTAVIVARSLIASLDTTPSALLVSAYDMLGRAQAETGEAEGSMHSSQRALRTAHAVNDTLGIRSALYQLGMANFNANRFDDALFYAQQLLPLLEGIDDPRHAGSLNMIGNVYYVRQEFDRGDDAVARSARQLRQALSA